MSKYLLAVMLLFTNHGFMRHGDSNDYMIAYSREAPEIENRPALLVIYVPR
jgi:hypothetical protein